MKQPDAVLQSLAEAKTVVIKIGSSVLTDGTGKLSEKTFQHLAKDIHALHQQSRRCILVSSGAVAAGKTRLSFQGKSLTIPQKQAAAAVGQGHLMHLYQKNFSKYQITTAQLLLTHDDLANRTRYLNARNTLATLLEENVVPIINENDSVIVEEIKFGDNDTLSALIATLVEADAFLILTDCAGLHDANPEKNLNAKLISCVEKIDETLLQYATPSAGKWGVGGMVTKITAAQRTTSFGIPTLIAQGGAKSSLPALLSGEPFVGTLFLPKSKDLSARKHWIAHTLRSKGKITIDAGAGKALVSQGKSLLPKGIIEVQGDFKLGDCVEVCDENKNILGRGLVNYSAKEIHLIKGKKTSEIQSILGYKYYDEVIHRDQWVVNE